MPIFPPAMNLGDLPHAIPSIMFSEPREGRKSITQVINWSAPVAKGLTAVSINLQNNATLEFSQICGLIVDNSQCGSDLTFIFPDTEVTVSIPAYAPYTVVNIATGQTQFFVKAAAPLAIDVTRFTILNFAPPPVAVPITRQQQAISVASITADGATTTQLIANTVSGSLQALNVGFANPLPAVSFNILGTVKDGLNNVLWSGNVALQNTSTGFIAALVDLNGLSLRFQQGLKFVQTGAAAPGGTFDVNAYYIVP